MSPFVVSGPDQRIESLLIKPVSAVCNLDCSYCFYLDREADPYASMQSRRMTPDTLERLVDSWMSYSYPESVFAFQGGEPTLAGLDFFERLVKLQQRYGRNGQCVGNSMQTNGILLTSEWCRFFRAYNWLVGVSLDGPEDMHDAYRLNKGGQGTWRRVMDSVQLMQREKVEFNVLCVLSQANVDKPRDVYRFFRKIGIDNLQFIPLAEFDEAGNRLPFAITAEQYGRFLTGIFDLWWPERRKVRVRTFDNIAEAVAGMKPGTCTMHDSCDSYAVVEYNGDVYPCDFFVQHDWKLGNIGCDSWTEIARNARRTSFASRKAIGHEACSSCQYAGLCRGGCPKFRHGPGGRFEDLDYFCQAYKMVFDKTVRPLRKEVARLMR